VIAEIAVIADIAVIGKPTTETQCRPAATKSKTLNAEELRKQRTGMR